VASSASEQSVAAATTRAPLIGVTTYQEQARSGVWDTEFALLHYAYVDMVVRAGGVPVLLPPQEGGAAEVVERLDGLILSGGADVAPQLYGAQPHARTTVVRPGRDDWEMRLLRQALAADLPLLGVCRGLELMNVALGGTLRQHLPDILGHEGHCPAPGVFGEVRVALRAGSAVARVLGPETGVRCHHHQGLDEIAPGLRVAGAADDGTVEAVELPERRFVLGVQWHPEQDGADLRLFEALVAAAAERNSDGARGQAADSAAAHAVEQGKGARGEHLHV